MASAAVAQGKKEENAAVPRRSRLLLAAGGALAVLVLLAAGWFGASYLGGESTHAEPATEASAAPTHEAAAQSAETHGAEGVAARAFGSREVVTLGTFTVNLKGNGGGRILRIEVQVEVDGGYEEAITAKKAPLRDTVLTLASDYTFSDLEGVDGKTRLRDELLGRMNSVLEGSPKVHRVYFTEFVVQ